MFKEFAWQWFREYVVSNNKYSERRTKQYILTASLVPFFGDKRVSDIGTHQIEQYKTWLTEKGLANKTINNHLTVLHTCLVAAYEWLRLAGAPPKVKWLKCPPPRTDYLTVEECDLLLAQAEGVVYELILTALRTGMRQGELKGLQWDSIDWFNRTLLVRHSHSDYTKMLGSPKSNRERHIPLDVDVYQVLCRRRERSGYVFLDAKRQPFDHYGMSAELGNVCGKAGLRKISWHVLRHTFATHLAMKGTPLHAVQMLLGHSAITTTMRYAHVAPSTLRMAIDLLNPKTQSPADFGQPVGNQWLTLHRTADHVESALSEKAEFS